MADHQQVEVLGRDAARPLPRRLVAAAVAVLLVAGLALFVADHAARQREQRALDRCAAAARQAVTVADAPLVAIANYVRPVLDNGPPGKLRRTMYALVSHAVGRAHPDLTAARRGCRDVDVLWAHGANRARRDACVRGLDLHAAFLRRVVRDGRVLHRTWPSIPASC